MVKMNYEVFHESKLEAFISYSSYLVGTIVTAIFLFKFIYDFFCLQSTNSASKDTLDKSYQRIRNVTLCHLVLLFAFYISQWLLKTVNMNQFFLI